MAEETKKTTAKSTKKPTTKSTKKPTTKSTKKPIAKSTKSTSTKVSTKKSTATKKQPSKSEEPKVSLKKSDASKSMKTTSSVSVKKISTTKPKVKKSAKPKKRVKKQDELSTLEALEQAVEHTDITEKEPLGKTFYLMLAITVYIGAFFYINNIVYNNDNILQSAIFAFATVFVFFVLMLFNVPMLIINFFVLPFRRLLKQSRKEIHKEIMFSVGKNKIQTSFNKYKSLFTLVLYVLFAGFLVYFSVMGSIIEGDKVLKIVTDAAVTLLIFLVVVCSWQYLFNIIPSILDKSIDARNGFILTLSAVVLAIYVVFLLLDIVFLAEIMIFVLIIGFVALLGVNLNMIIGEINIFQNLRGRKSKVVTRVVFMVFFGFHVYVILYASVVAYSIYNWEPNSFVFSTFDYEQQIVTKLEDYNGASLTTVYWDHDNDDTTDVIQLTEVYWDHDNSDSTPVVLLQNCYDEDLVPVTDIRDSNGVPIKMTNSDGEFIDEVIPSDDIGPTTCLPFYNDGTFACSEGVRQLHTYGDFLYWTVVTVSTIGYGDVHPSTEYNIAMGWGGFLGIYGLTFFALSISFVSNIAMEGVNSVREENKKDD